jgi:hypothetical protein
MKRIINLSDFIKFIEKLASNKEFFEAHTIYVLLFDGETDELYKLDYSMFDVDKKGIAYLDKNRKDIQANCFAASVYGTNKELLAYYSEINGLIPETKINK